MNTAQAPDATPCAEATSAVRCSTRLGGFSEQTRAQSIKDVAACWPRLANSALEATKSLNRLIALISERPSDLGDSAR